LPAAQRRKAGQTPSHMRTRADTGWAEARLCVTKASYRVTNSQTRHLSRIDIDRIAGSASERTFVVIVMSLDAVADMCVLDTVGECL
jgi:hypothetical protein